MSNWEFKEGTLSRRSVGHLGVIPPTSEQQSYLHSPFLFFILKEGLLLGKQSPIAKSQPILPKAARCQIVCVEAKDSAPENSSTLIAVTARNMILFYFFF